jgi:rod shape-determining protein MreC
MFRRILIAVALILVLIILPTSLVTPLRDRGARTTAPVGGFFVRESAAIRNFFHTITQIGSLRDDKQKLQTQVLTLQQQLAAQENLQRENDTLRKELGVTGVSRSSKKVFARVILQGSDPLDYTFTVNVGSADGVKEGQPAVSQGFLIGRVMTVREHSSIVRSITSRKSGIQAWLAETREKGYLVADGNVVLLSQITQGVTVKPDSVIETSGLGGSIPQGILIGQVGALESAPSQLTQTFRVTLPYDPKSLESLFILLVDTGS